MASPKKSDFRPKEVRPRFPISGYRREIYANRVAVEWTGEGAAVISFALQAKTGVIADFEREVVSPEGVARHREGMVAFLDRLGVDDPDLPLLPLSPPGQTLGVADEFIISTGPVSEVIFAGFSVGALTAERPDEVFLQGVLRVQGSPAVLWKRIRLLYLHESST